MNSRERGISRRGALQLAALPGAVVLTGCNIPEKYAEASPFVRIATATVGGAAVGALSGYAIGEGFSLPSDPPGSSRRNAIVGATAGGVLLGFLTTAGEGSMLLVKGVVNSPNRIK